MNRVKLAVACSLVVALVGCTGQGAIPVHEGPPLIGTLIPQPSLPKSWPSGGNVQFATQYMVAGEDGEARALLLKNAPKSLVPIVEVTFLNGEAPIGDVLRMATEADC